ncbi:hypothetical protein QM543_07255 [Pantoea eucrina]|uniref:hypothetical protein n=1 Tax=Pantoea eucrina TaxID=472693 RepID=UPI0024B643FA|nr:hypothetical protein [Pantoea eucrina]MDJ0023078.1 hypothetical protein [Pantoea eucrina]
MKIKVYVKRSELAEMDMDEYGLKASICDDLNANEDEPYSGFNVDIEVTEDV